MKLGAIDETVHYSAYTEVALETYCSAVELRMHVFT